MKFNIDSILIIFTAAIFGAGISAVVISNTMKNNYEEYISQIQIKHNERVKSVKSTYQEFKDSYKEYYDDSLERKEKRFEERLSRYRKRYCDDENSSIVAKNIEVLDDYAVKEKSFSANDIDNQRNDTYRQFKSYLDSGSFEKALEIYAEELSSYNKEWYTSKLRTFVYKKFKENDSSGRYYAKRLNFVDPDESYFVYIWMMSEVNTGKYVTGLEKVIELRSMNVPNNTILANINNFYNFAVNKYFKKFIKSDNRTDILLAMNFLSEMQEYDKEAKLKNRIFELNDRDNKKLLDDLRKLQEERERWKAQEEKERLAKFYNIQIPLKKRGKHYLVPVRINEDSEFDMMLDTGASYVTVKSDLLKKYNPTLIKRNVTFNTANGTTKSNKYLVDEFSVGEVNFKNFPLYGMDNYKSSYNEGLFGMYFLEKFDWEIDERNEILFLNKKY